MGKKAEKSQNTVQTPPVGQLASGKVYVVGHKNPDTDSICSAIAYAALKHKITGNVYEARRAGQINEETSYVL